MYTRYVTSDSLGASVHYNRVSFFLGSREIYVTYVKDGAIPYYNGFAYPQIKGWTTKKGGGHEKFEPVYSNRIYYAVIDDEIGITLGQIKYALGDLPTRNYRSFFVGSVLPQNVEYDERLELYTTSVDISYLKGSEWVCICPDPSMDEDGIAEYFYVSPIRQNVEKGKVNIQMLNKPDMRLSFLFRIDDYVEWDVEPEETDMTKEEILALFGDTPTVNKVIEQSHTKSYSDVVGSEITVDLPELEDGDSVDFDTADNISEKEHKDWRKAGITFDRAENGKAILKVHGTVSEDAVFHFFTRINKQKEI